MQELGVRVWVVVLLAAVTRGAELWRNATPVVNTHDGKIHSHGSNSLLEVTYNTTNTTASDGRTDEQDGRDSQKVHSYDHVPDATSFNTDYILDHDVDSFSDDVYHDGYVYPPVILGPCCADGGACCENGGTCFLYTECLCTSNFTGSLCETPLNGLSCGRIQHLGVLVTRCCACECYDGVVDCLYDYCTKDDECDVYSASAVTALTHFPTALLISFSLALVQLQNINFK